MHGHSFCVIIIASHNHCLKKIEISASFVYTAQGNLHQLICLRCCSVSPSMWLLGCSISLGKDLSTETWLPGISLSQRITFARCVHIILVFRSHFSVMQILFRWQILECHVTLLTRHTMYPVVV